MKVGFHNTSVQGLAPPRPPALSDQRYVLPRSARGTRPNQVSMLESRKDAGLYLGTVWYFDYGLGQYVRAPFSGLQRWWSGKFSLRQAIGNERRPGNKTTKPTTGRTGQREKAPAEPVCLTTLVKTSAGAVFARFARKCFCW